MTAPLSTGRLTDDLQAAFLKLIEQRYGLVSSDHTRREIAAAVAAVLDESPFADAQTLWSALASGQRADLLDLLGMRLTVGETHFFRVAPQINALREVIYPDLIARKADTHRLRIWSAGCSTGEETYTLALLQRELDLSGWQVELLGTDVSRRSIETARNAVYGEWSFRDTPEHIRDRYFVRDGRRWRLDQSVRDQVCFSYLNLAEALPSAWLQPGGFDLIMCRNVTIYFNEETVRALYAELERALLPGGWLVLGPSDPVPDATHTLTSVYRPGVVLWRRPLPGANVAATGTATGPATAPGQARVAPRKPAAGGTLIRKVAPRPVVPPRPVAAAATTTVAAQPASADALADGPRAYLQSGLRQLDAGAVQEAVESFRRSIYLDGNNPLAHFGLGLAFARVGERDRARSACVQAERLLAVLPDEAAVRGSQDVLVGDLRLAVAAQLQAVGG